MLFLKGSAIFKSAPQITSLYFKQTPKFPRQQKPNPTGLLENKDLFISSFRASLRLNIFLVSWLFIWECCCWQCHLIVGKWLQVLESKTTSLPKLPAPESLHLYTSSSWRKKKMHHSHLFHFSLRPTPWLAAVTLFIPGLLIPQLF